jgi:ParB/Sulfiredoxin domain
MRLDANFLPMGVDPGDELFRNGIFEFNITRLLDHINSNLDSFPIERLRVRDLHVWSPEDPDESTIQKADLSFPIVLAEIRPGHFNVIDGNHRLESARRDEVESISAYRLSPTQHHRFLTSRRAYEAYVDYWNSKVDAG